MAALQEVLPSGKHDYRWCAEEDLLREVAAPPAATRLCQNWAACRREEPLEAAEGARFQACGKCGVKYCCRKCQVACWKSGHKAQCARLQEFKAAAAAAVTTGASGSGSTSATTATAARTAAAAAAAAVTTKLSAATRRGIVQRVIHGHRIYMCPFAVCKYQSIGRGFLLITSIDNPIDSFIYTRPVDRLGRRLDRRIDLEYLDMGEYAELCKSDFELGAVRDGLVSAIDSYDPQKQMVVMWVAACGYLGVLIVPIVPDFGVCKVLGADHAKQRTIQLALDVVDSPEDLAALDEAAKAQAQDLLAKMEKQ
jgi:hypothetical protein